MNVAELLRRQAAARPQSIALREVRRGQCRSLTFAQLERAAGQVATLFRNADLQNGDAVLVIQPMSIDLYVVLAAIFRLGLVAIVLDPAGGVEHIDRIPRKRSTPW
jgi:acyl-CoA synthetase (AMP-forming)/AMP-acid ligase II